MPYFVEYVKGGKIKQENIRSTDELRKFMANIRRDNRGKTLLKQTIVRRIFTTSELKTAAQRARKYR